MALINETGFVLKTQNEYFEQERAAYLAIDPDFDLDPSSPDGAKLARDSEVFGNLDETLKRAYDSKDPNKARGIELATIGRITGSEFDEGSPSDVLLRVGGTVGAAVPAGSVFAPTDPDNPVRWSTTEAGIVGAGGTVDVDAQSTTNGTFQASPGTITRIVNTIAGVLTVTNPSAAIPGRNRQTNGQFRIERRRTVARPGNNTLDAMLSDIFAVPGVSRAIVYENDTNITDSNGLPAHSYAAIVEGGSDAAVARAMFSKKTLGVAQHFANPNAGGQVTENVQSTLHPRQPAKAIQFSRAVDVNMTLAATVINDGTLPANAAALIQQAILDFTNAELIPAEAGFKINGFDIGENVPVSTMATPINQVIGQFGNSRISALTLNGLTFGQVVSVPFNSLSRWLEANITITVN